MADGRLAELAVERGAPCGATWALPQRLAGLAVKEALTQIGLEAQFCCVADPAGWDPITGRSPVHLAGELHRAALARALGLTAAQNGDDRPPEAP